MSGTAIKASTDAFNTRGKIVSGVGTDWKTITLPFSTLAPRYMPGDCALVTFCEAPSFNPESALGFQYSLYSQFDKYGKYDLWVDDVTLTTGDAGLPTLTQTAGAFVSRPTKRWAPAPSRRALAAKRLSKPTSCGRRRSLPPTVRTSG